MRLFEMIDLADTLGDADKENHRYVAGEVTPSIQRTRSQ
jgi:hypothetical protein